MKRFKRASDNDDYPIDPEKIAEVRREMVKRGDELALSDPLCSFLHSSNYVSPDPFWEYDSDYSDLDGPGPF